MIIFTSILMSLQLQSAPSLCPPDAECRFADEILVIADSQEDASRIHAIAASARERFEALFGALFAPTAIIIDPDRRGSAFNTLSEAGFIIQPWVSADTVRAQVADQLTSVMAQRMPDANPQAHRAAAERMAAQTLEGRERFRHEEAIIAHELGHMWFREAYEWTETGGEARVYGAAGAPDWLDETAAVLMETEALTAERRSGLCERAPASPAARAMLLDAYFAMPHPLLNLAHRMDAQARAAEAEAGEESDGARVMVLNQETLAAQGGGDIGVETYYEFTRALVDYAEQTGAGSQVFNDIAGFLAADGADLAAWFSQHGEAVGLGTNLDELKAGLDAMIVERCEL